MTKLFPRPAVKVARPGYDKRTPGSRFVSVRGFSGMHQLPLKPGWRKAGYYNTPV